MQTLIDVVTNILHSLLKVFIFISLVFKIDFCSILLNKWNYKHHSSPTFAHQKL